MSHCEKCGGLKPCGCKDRPGGYKRFPDEGFEEWRAAPNGMILVTVDHNDDMHPIGIGDDDHVVWLTFEHAKWVRSRLDEAILAARGAAARAEKRLVGKVKKLR